MTAQAIENLLKQAQNEHITVIALTDEELTVLDGPETEQIAPRPWYDAQDAAAQETICQVALRGLVARGIAAPEVLNEEGDVALHLSDDVRAVLAARQAASFLVLAARTTADGTHSRVLFGRPGGVAVEEDVTEGGLHILSAGPTEVLTARLAEFCDLYGAASEQPTSAPRLLPLTEVAAGAGQEVFGNARSVTQINRVTLDEADEPEEERISVYALADTLFVAESAQDGENGMLALTEHDPAGLRGRLHGLLRP